MDGLRRELLEEAGAEMLSFTPVGAWYCQAKARYKPHSAFPNFYRYVGVGEVRLIAQPTNPADGEQVEEVLAVSLQQAQAYFTQSKRPDLAELYELASQVKHGQA
jgi:8-oxo-dGTP diphosphatase